ncbi:hypothetical protein HELRODRAFT_161627 [Helobdella robusta]|uniref:dCMP deaminase n=1 Tax=Helobdella robusta TaxID=6412 RepID=T1ERQ4_HELRO|nr:hypothetical protein HELRODRAFT_161627 [Helobdella robusta]ESO02367.1 hypothetical protein HELRODRAFT_161627 [Helobdella robusta]
MENLSLNNEEVLFNNGNSQTGKRNDYLEWEDYFMAVAILSAQRSKDPAKQVGACIVSEDKKIVGIGYNGMPNGCSDDELPWVKNQADELDNKFAYVCHAEMNAIMNKNTYDVKDCTIYTALFPCNECAKLIIQSGIRQIVYLSDENKNKKSILASKRMFNLAGISYRQFESKRSEIVINLRQPEAH